MGGGSSVIREKRVVIVGCGYAGANMAKLLMGKCKVTIIDSREYFHHCIGSLRASVEPGFENKILVPFAQAWGDSFKQGKVETVDPEKNVVILETGEEIPYDYVVIATGSSGPFPGKLGLNVITIEDAKTHFKKIQEQIKAADKITIIGAGAVGVEMAGEIAVDYPKKEVTVVTNAENVVNGPFKDKLRDSIKKQLTDLGVKLVFDETVANLSELPKDGSSPCVVKTNKGTEINTDLVIVCIGMSSNCDAYKEYFADCMDDYNNLKVNQYLQVEGYSNVFAIGDCNDATSPKMALKAEGQSEIVAKNIKALETKGSLSPYKELTSIISVSIGRNGGATQLKAAIMGSFFTKKLKSNDMMYGKFWSLLNQKAPH
ncbi:Apoptosis-inducing factor 2 [Holothuria leucospilota]|uniref:Ferroptosis suppressor protein 1 n=1 Tax=Holothuria leucospilota TaxID=206669 RepID=A0A9Q1BQ45_HOLLE|nr:Apoptosis-inducing factor 2 [Holothuria leucospilota]